VLSSWRTSRVLTRIARAWLLSSVNWCNNCAAPAATWEDRSLNSPMLLLRLTQVTFWAAVIFTFTDAVLPAQQAVQIASWHYAEHVIAFYVLAVLAAAAYPRLNVIWIAILLSGFGAVIEIVQGLKIVSRDPDFRGWATDTLAIAAALAPMFLVTWRAHMSGLPRLRAR
jgi:hypothetical protein